jgi:hypothetical protein
LISWINTHGKWAKYSPSPRQSSAGTAINITRWTAHYVAFSLLFILRTALQLAVLQKKLLSSLVQQHQQKPSALPTTPTNLIEDATYLPGVVLKRDLPRHEHQPQGFDAS